MKHLVAAILLSIAVSANAFAAWETIATSPDGKLHAYIEDGRISKKNGVVTYWQKEDQEDGGDVRVKAEINCKTQQRREHDYYQYDGQGNVVQQFKDTTEWKDIIPGSVNDLIYKRLCK